MLLVLKSGGVRRPQRGEVSQRVFQENGTENFQRSMAERSLLGVEGTNEVMAGDACQEDVP